MSLILNAYTKKDVLYTLVYPPLSKVVIQSHPKIEYILVLLNHFLLILYTFKK